MLVGWSPDADLVKVANGVHGLREPSLRGASCPQERLGIRLWENAWRADEVPSRERKARITMVLLSGNVLGGSGDFAVSWL